MFYMFQEKVNSKIPITEVNVIVDGEISKEIYINCPVDNSPELRVSTSSYKDSCE